MQLRHGQKLAGQLPAATAAALAVTPGLAATLMPAVVRAVPLFAGSRSLVRGLTPPM